MSAQLQLPIALPAPACTWRQVWADDLARELAALRTRYKAPAALPSLRTVNGRLTMALIGPQGRLFAQAPVPALPVPHPHEDRYLRWLALCLHELRRASSCRGCLRPAPPRVRLDRSGHCFRCRAIARAHAQLDLEIP